LKLLWNSKAFWLFRRARALDEHKTTRIGTSYRLEPGKWWDKIQAISHPHVTRRIGGLRNRGKTKGCKDAIVVGETKGETKVDRWPVEFRIGRNCKVLSQAAFTYILLYYIYHVKSAN
jgi:hypothetical protein